MNGSQQLTMRRLGRRTMTWKAAWFGLAAWLASAPGMLCPVANAQIVTKTIGITFPQSLQVNPVTNRIYVANFTSETSPNNVIVIDGATDSTTAITTGVGTAAVAVNPVTNKIYAANFLDNDVTVIDGATNSTTTVPVGVGPLAVAVNPTTNKIYVGNTTDNSVTVIDGATNTTTMVTAGGTPPDHLINLAVNPVTDKIYVFNDGNGIITVIDGATNSTTLLNVVSAPSALAVNPVTNKIYLANGSNFITVMDGATNSTTTIPTGNGPASIAVNPVTNKIYVANFADNDVTVIDGVTNSTTTVATNANPNEVAVDPLTNQIFVGHFDADTVVIDGNTNTATDLAGTLTVAEITVNPVTHKVYFRQGGDVLVIDPAAIAKTLVPVEPFNTAPLSIAANAATNKIYIPNSSSNDVTVIDGVTNTSTTVAAGSAPVAVEVNPVTNKIYVADNGDNTVTVIDGATNSTITVASGSAPTAVAVNPVTNKIYVANNGDNTVTVIDGITNSTTTVAARGQPGAVAVNPVTNKIYVANFSGNNITVIDGATNSTASVPVGAPPQALAVNPVTNKIYVANSFNIAVIDGATNATANFANVGALLVEVNPITNKIYFATGFNSLMVLDGATNNIQTVTVPNSLTLANLAVNPATNKIYLADADFSNVTVIDGATNTIIATIPTTLVFGIGLAVNPTAVNPVTDTVYLAAGNVNSASVLVLQEKRAQLTPVQAAIAPFPGNITGILTPTFQLSAAPLAPPVQAMYMQIDTWQGPWMAAAASDGSGQFTATLRTPLQPGVHIAYAWADPQDDPPATGFQNQISATPIISNIAAYVFVVSPPSAGLSPANLIFGNQPVNTISPAQTVTLTNANGPLDIGGISVSGHFQESDNCPAQLAAGANCTISVVFAPLSGDQGNTVTGAVTISDDNNGITGNTDTIALTGMGIAPVAAPPTITKAFGSAGIPLNGSTSLMFTVSNPNSAVALSGIAFSDLFPAGLIVSASPALNSSCGGTVSAPAGSVTVNLSGGTLAANASCTISVNVTGTTAGAKNNTTTAPTSTEGGTGVASNTASIMVVSPPVFLSTTFGAASIPLNGSTSFTLAIQNNNAGTMLTGVGFTDTLPAGLIVSTPNGLTGSCGGGTITATAGTNIVSLSGAGLAASSSCTFTVNVTGTVAGTQNNTTGNVTSTEGGPGNTSNASITIVGPPVINKTFGAASIPLNGSTSLTFTIQNNNAATMLTGVAFTDTLPAGLMISTPNGLSGGCAGGAITATQTTSAISLTGAGVAAGTSCSFSVNVTGSTGGVKNNITGNVTSTEGGTGGTASATVTVLMPDLAITKTHAGNFTQGQTVGATYTITVSNVGTAPTMGAVTVTDALPAGLTAIAIGGTGWTCPTLTSCNRSDVLANGSSFPAITLTVSVALNAPASVVNSVTVSGGGQTNHSNDTAADTTAIAPLSGPPLTIVPLNNSANVSIPAGSPATFDFTVTSSSALLGGINFTCSGLPPGASCSFDKQGETQPQAQVTMTITTAASARMFVPTVNSGGTALLCAVVLLPFFGLVQLKSRGWKSESFRPRVTMLLGSLAFLLILAACGGRSGTPGTPGVTYQISVMAASSTTPSVQAVTVVNLTVQ